MPPLRLLPLGGFRFSFRVQDAHDLSMKSRICRCHDTAAVFRRTAIPLVELKAFPYREPTTGPRIGVGGPGTGATLTFDENRSVLIGEKDITFSKESSTGTSHEDLPRKKVVKELTRLLGVGTRAVPNRTLRPNGW